MIKFKKFAQARPFLFGLVVIVIYSVLGTLTYPVHFLFPENEVGQLLGDALSKLIIFLVFLVILQRFGWLKASGFNKFSNRDVWLVLIVVLVYKSLSWLYAFTGNLSFSLPRPDLAAANLFLQLQTSLVEETMMRGLVLTAMIMSWGDTRNGQIKAVVLSSVFFGLIHLINLIVRPFDVVLIQAVINTLPGILYASLLLTYRSIWPGIIIHWLTNAAINIKLIGNQGYQENIGMWLTAGLLFIPLLVYSGYLISRLPENYPDEYPEEFPVVS